MWLRHPTVSQKAERAAGGLSSLADSSAVVGVEAPSSLALGAGRGTSSLGTVKGPLPGVRASWCLVTVPQQPGSQPPPLECAYKGALWQHSGRCQLGWEKGQLSCVLGYPISTGLVAPHPQLLGPGLGPWSTGCTRPGGTDSPWQRGAGVAQEPGSREAPAPGLGEPLDRRVEERPEEVRSRPGPAAAQAPCTASGTSGTGCCELPAFNFSRTLMSQLWCGCVVSPGAVCCAEPWCCRLNNVKFPFLWSNRAAHVGQQSRLGLPEDSCLARRCTSAVVDADAARSAGSTREKPGRCGRT